MFKKTTKKAEERILEQNQEIITLKRLARKYQSEGYDHRNNLENIIRDLQNFIDTGKFTDKACFAIQPPLRLEDSADSVIYGWECMEKQLKIIVELLPEAFDKQKGLFALREAELLDIIKCYKSEPNAKMAQEIIRLRDKNTKLENELQHGQKCLETVLGEQTE